MNVSQAILAPENAAPPALRPTISVALIALNEAPRLPGLLDRLWWSDEIVVVDGGSTDATVAIARSYGCKLLRHPFDNFAEQRNRALRAATGDWILFLDADELPTASLVREIRAAVLRDDVDAWRISIRSKIFGRRFRFSGTQDDCPIRLLRRGRGVWQGSVHETLRIRGGVGRLGSALHHDTIADLKTFVAKMHRYTSLAARQRLAQGVRPRLRDPWLRPAYEIFRRLIWKRGILDGPAGWLFCLLSGWSEWILAQKHRRLWTASREAMLRPAASARLQAAETF